MNRLSESERKGVETAIGAAETGTTAEFVAVVASRADRYHVVSLTGGLLAALAAAVIVLLIEPWASLLLSLAAQCIAFAVVYAVLELTPLSVRLAPRKARELKARRLAHLLFMERGLASLPQHNGVLLLAALAEHQVEIVADHGIDRLAGSATRSSTPLCSGRLARPRSMNRRCARRRALTSRARCGASRTESGVSSRTA